jgi:hypothetical protein
MPRRIRLPVILGLVALILFGGLLWWWLARPTWTVERVRDVAVTTLQEETPASDLVAGRIGVTADRQIHDRGRFSWVPGWFSVPGINFVGADVRVQVVGEALYGFDVRELRPEMITLAPDGVIEVALPGLRVISVEPDLGRLQVESREGVFRSGAARPLESEALRDVQEALRQQGERHLQTSDQPRINAARALTAVLRPAFVSAGMPDPRFRVRISDEVVIEPAPERRPDTEGRQRIPLTESDAR